MGEQVNLTFKDFLTSEIGAMSQLKVTTLELIYTFINIEGSKQFYKDFILQDLSVTPAHDHENNVLNKIHANIGQIWDDIDP